MSEQRHTPGPWEAINGDHVRDANGIVICEIREMGILEHAANANLIATAPDLLSIARRWAALDGGAWHAERHASEKAELLADTLAAIAKATEA